MSVDQCRCRRCNRIIKKEDWDDICEDCVMLDNEVCELRRQNPTKEDFERMMEVTD